jgi:hypothetical protein
MVRGIHQQDIFHRVVFFLTAITRRLLRSILGADDAPLGAVMGTRGDAGAAAGPPPPGADSSTSEATTDAASVSGTPRRCARAARERVEEQSIFRRRQGAVFIHGKPTRGPRFPSHPPHRHMGAERRLKGQDQLRKLVERHAGHIQQRRGARLQIGKP